MLSLRITRGSRPSVLLRRLMVAAASGGTGFLLLAALGHGVAYPGQADASLVRLAWCLLPLAAAVHLAVTVARTESHGRSHSGPAARFDPVRLPPPAATTALSCALGSAAAFPAFLLLRGALPGADRPLPVAGALTLLAAVPLLAAGVIGLRLRPGRTVAGLPWDAALIVSGLAAGAVMSGLTRPTSGAFLTLPGGLGSVAPATAAGWALSAAGLVLIGPGFVRACGDMLASGRPGALRLLAGRGLRDAAHHLGYPLGVLCAVTAAGVAAIPLYGAGGRPPGPFSALGATVVGCCAVATALTAAAEVRLVRRSATAALADLGASRTLVCRAAALRAGILLALAAPPTCLVAHLTTLPLRP